MSLSDDEVGFLHAALGRALTDEERALFTGMWSEHCSYKSTRDLVEDLPSSGEFVVAGPGAHAGIVDVGDGLEIAFKIESHNHPSAVEPYQGAATGVGGVLRDVIAAGARPLAILSGLAFAAWPYGSDGSDDDRRIARRVVDGIAGYGNAIGVAHVGGTVVHGPRFAGAPLVNVLALGVLRRGALRTAGNVSTGDAVLLVGARTGPDGVHGAAFASRRLETPSRDLPHVQVGDPFGGRKLLEAALGIDDVEAAVLHACQDLGAAGIACAICEIAARGGRGVAIELERVPLRDEAMTPAEILLSESQERFVFVVAAGGADAALAHFLRRGLVAARIGEIVADDRVLVRHRGNVVVDVPASLVTGCPPAPRAVPPSMSRPTARRAPTDAHALVARLGSREDRSRSAIFERFDQTVGAATVFGPEGASAAVLALPGSGRGIAISLTAGLALEHGGDARLAARDAVLRAVRDVACTGARPAALTDGINAGPPDVPTASESLAGLFSGLREAAVALSLPFVSGNVSLYNAPGSETVFVGCLGRLDRTDRAIGIRAERGAHLVLVRRGADDDVDADLRLARILPDLADGGMVVGARAVGRAGALVSLAKLCATAGIGIVLEPPAEELDRARAIALVVVRDSVLARVLGALRDGLAADAIGRFGGAALAANGIAALPVSELRASFRHASSLP